LRQVEAKLQRSDAYRQAIAGLQTCLDGTAEDIQSWIRTVSREAMRLAVQQLIVEYQAAPAVPPQLQAVPDKETASAPLAPLPSVSTRASTLPATSTPWSQPSVEPPSPEPIDLALKSTALPVPVADELQAGSSLDGSPDAASTADQTDLDSPPISIPNPLLFLRSLLLGRKPVSPERLEDEEQTPDSDPPDLTSTPAPEVTSPVLEEKELSPLQQSLLPFRALLPAKKQSKADLIEQEREVVLRQIGAELQQARQDQGMSLQQLHNKTWVPIHHLKSLETGALELLPEDIYVRGFIRRVATALGLDGVAMAASIPMLEPAKMLVPSWQQSVKPTAAYISPVYLYLGYAALMAGAVGGLAWLSHPSNSPEPLPPSSLEPAQSPVTPVDRAESGKLNQTGSARSIANPAMVPPETIPF
jgi:hypothetical protein